MQTQDIDYRADADMRGYLAFDEAKAGPRPGVLVFHEGLGLGDFVMARARMLAELGYVAFAADMFGEGRQARNLQEVAKLVGGLRSEPEIMRKRGRAALATLKAMPQVDAGRMAAIVSRTATASQPRSSDAGLGLSSAGTPGGWVEPVDATAVDGAAGIGQW